MANWNIPPEEITVKVTPKIVPYAEKFGTFLGTSDYEGKNLTTSQLRRFFGEVKRQQMIGYDETEFALLKPKLAYAVARDDNKTKIKIFYEVMANAIDLVKDEVMFKNFIKVFEAIVAYHKVAEKKK